MCVCVFEGLEKWSGCWDRRRCRIWRTSMKTNYSDLKFHLLLAETVFPLILTTPLLSFPSRPFSVLIPPISGLFRRWQEERIYIYVYIVSRRETNSRRRGRKVFFRTPRGAPGGTSFIIMRNFSKSTVNSFHWRIAAYTLRTVNFFT